MKIKTLVPFLVILVLLLGLVAWQKMNQKAPAPIAVQVGLESLVPDSLKKDTIERVEMFSGTAPDEKVVLKRQGEEWSIASLYDAPANKETVTAFIDKLLKLKGEPRANADSDEKLANFALKDAEAFRVQAFQSGADVPAMDILVGKAADFKTVFVRKAGDSKVFVESNNLRREAGAGDTEADAKPKSSKWLKASIFEVDTNKVTKVALKYPDKEMSFERKEVVKEPATDAAKTPGEGEAAPAAEPEKTFEWTLSQGGFAAQFKDTEFKSLLAKFANISATDVVDAQKKAEFGFDPPAYSATLSIEGGSDIVLYGGRNTAGGDTYMQQAGVEPALIYQVSKFNFEQIFIQGAKLFTLPEWTVDKEAIAGISIQRPEGVISIQKQESDWAISEPQLALETQKTALSGIAAAAASLKPTDYADAGVDVGVFDATVTVRMNDGTTRTLLIGQPSKTIEGRYAKFEGSDAVLVISRADYEKLAPPVRDLYALSVFDMDAESIQQFHLVHEGKDLLLNHDKNAGTWTGTINGAAITPTAEMVENFVMTLNGFQVDNFALDKSPDTVQALTTLTVTEAPDKVTTLSIGPDANGVHDASISGIPYLFTVKSVELVKLLADADAFAPKQEEAKPAPEAGPAPTETPAADPVTTPIPVEIAPAVPATPEVTLSAPAPAPSVTLPAEPAPAAPVENAPAAQ